MGGKSKAQQVAAAAVRQRVRELLATGKMTYLEIAAEAGCCEGHVYLVNKRFVRPPRKRSVFRLSYAEREEISRGLAKGSSAQTIARALGRAASTVSREVAAQPKGDYRAWRGEEFAETQSHRPKPRKLKTNAPLRAAVEEGLAKRWSPEQISKRLRVEHPENPSMRVSHETIYRALYVQGKGILRRELASHLRAGARRTRQRRRTQTVKNRFVQGMVNISERPAEANDRAVPGHWEGDLIKGALNKSCIGTLVERTTRFVMLLHLPTGGTAQDVQEALTKKIRALPAELRRSLTWDQGAEMAQHAQFTIDTGVQVFFCDPHSPWQRGSNENTNGLLRQYFPKGESLADVTEERLDEVARELNGRPRMTLSWRTPAEALNESLRQRAA